MTEKDILNAISQGEDQFQEFKTIIDNPESIAGELTAFVNCGHGRLYLGVDDDGQITGVADVEKEFQSLTNICRDRCVPPISPLINQYRVHNKDIIIVEIRPEYNRQKPYRTAGGRFYIRVGKDKKDATGRELMRIAQAAGELHYDETPIVGSSVSELSNEDFDSYHQLQFGMSVEEHLNQGADLKSLLTNLRLLVDVDAELMMTVAGLLVFGKNPQKFLPHSRLSAAAFAGENEDADIIDRLEITGRLPAIIDGARVFTERNIRKPAVELGFNREDVLLYDRKSIGEAIVNAIVHRDYSLTGSQIRIFIYRNRIEIRSPGSLPNSVTLDNIKLGVHAERNRTVVRLMTQLGYLSAIGTGIPRLIIRLTRQLSGREPEFELVGDEFRVRIWAKST